MKNSQLKYTKWVLLFAGFLLTSHAEIHAQLTLAEVLSNTVKNAPDAALVNIALAEMELKKENLKKLNYLQLGLMAQATYQSDVTSIPIDFPGIDIPSPSKDQYKIQAEVKQLIYDGGMINGRKVLLETTAQIASESIEIKLEKLREQSIEIFFSIIETEIRLKLLDLKKEDLLASLKRIEAGVENGVLLKSEAYTLQAALLEMEQQVWNLKAARKTQFEVLNLLMGTKLPENTLLQIPDDLPVAGKANGKKAIYRLLDLQTQTILQKEVLDKSGLRPKASAFLQGGLGKPGLDFLSDSFSPFYIVGLQVNWNLNKLYTRSNDGELYELGRRKIDTEKENYTLWQSTRIKQYEIEIEKLNGQIEYDNQLFDLREKVKRISKVQLDNGILTASDYLIKVNDQFEAGVNKELRQIQLKKATYLLKHEKGNLDF